MQDNYISSHHIHQIMVRKGPDAPKGMMTAKGYREKVVIP